MDFPQLFDDSASSSEDDIESNINVVNVPFLFFWSDRNLKVMKEKNSPKLHLSNK